MPEARTPVPHSIVIKLSGCLFDLRERVSGLKPFLPLFRELHEGGVRLILVAGGGETARRYISSARSLGGDEASLDEIGIRVSQLNARLLIAGMKGVAYPTVPETLEEVAEAVESGKVVVLGGLHPGHSTNAVAALVAERVRADMFINTTDVEGVYTGDPRRRRGVKKLDRVEASKLTELLIRVGMGAGTYELMDLVALKVIQRSKIATRVVKCSVEAVRRAVRGEDVGTLIAV